jgi:hypothetical protein
MSYSKPRNKFHLHHIPSPHMMSFSQITKLIPTHHVGEKKETKKKKKKKNKLCFVLFLIFLVLKNQLR